MNEIVLAQIGEVAKAGIVGALLILAVWRIVVLEKKLTAAQEDRVKDWKEVGTLLEQNSVALAAQNTASEARARALDASVRSQELSAQTLTTIASNMAAMTQQISEMATALRQTREALITKGVPV